MTLKKVATAGILLLGIVICGFLHFGVFLILFLLWFDTFVIKRFPYLSNFGIETMTIGVLFLGWSFGPILGFLGGLLLPLVFGLLRLLVEAYRQKERFSAPKMVDPVNAVIGLLAGVFAGNVLLTLGTVVIAKFLLSPVFLFLERDDVSGVFLKTVANVVNAVLVTILFFLIGPLAFF